MAGPFPDKTTGDNLTADEWNTLSNALENLKAADVGDFADAVNALLTAGTNVSVNYDAAAGTLTISATDTDTNTQLTGEEVRTIVQQFVTAGDNISVAHNDAGDTLTFAVTGLTLEDITDYSAEMGINNQTGTAYTLTLGDQDTLVRMDNAAANTVTVPPESSVNFLVGAVVAVSQIGAGQTTIAAGTGVTVNGPGMALAEQWASASLTKVGADEWQITGNVQ